MNYKHNPTALRTGMSGTLLGKHYRVIGRVVMGMEEDGETYYWNEFNLLDNSGENATLVYEETERGGMWKLFTMFAPEYPMTAADAATRKIGDELNLEGTQVRVTLVDESRVYYIEDQAPEGVEIGDVAHYFNAEARNTMIVVSWTGDEVEYFRGKDLSRYDMQQGFKISTPTTSSVISNWPSADGSSTQSTNLKWAAVIIPFVVIGSIFVFIAVSSGSRRSRHSSPPAMKHVAAATQKLQTGAVIKLDGKSQRIRSHTLMGIDAIGASFDRHEYEMVDDEENLSLLVQGAKDFTLFTPLQPFRPMPQTAAAALRMGNLVDIDGYVAPLTEIFQSKVLNTDTSSHPDTSMGSVLFGFTAKTNSTLLLARWTHNQIAFYRGRTLSEREIDTFGKNR